MWARMRLLNNVNFCLALWVTNSLTAPTFIQRNASVIKDDFLNTSLNTTALGGHGYVLYLMSQIGFLASDHIGKYFRMTVSSSWYSQFYFGVGMKSTLSTVDTENRKKNLREVLLK